MAALTTKNPIRIVQITDTHLYGKSVGTLLKMNTQDSLNEVVKLAKENEGKMDLILATGDIAQDASEDAYRSFLKTINLLDAPFRWIPGNHDSASLMEKLARDSEANEKTVRINNWLIVLLDTSIDGQVHGRLAKSELSYLQETLSAAQQDDSIDHCLITLHHNPVAGTAGWMKDIGLRNAGEFFKIVERFPKANSIVYAHIHQELDFMHNKLRCFCSPSTCIQFKPHVPGFELDKLNPGYRAFSLFPDGTIESEVVRVAGATREADFKSEGY